MEISHSLKKYSHFAHFHSAIVSMVSVRTWKTCTLFDTHFGEVSHVDDNCKFQKINKLVGTMVETNEVTFNSNICKVILIYFLKNSKSPRLNRISFNTILNL